MAMLPVQMSSDAGTNPAEKLPSWVLPLETASIRAWMKSPKRWNRPSISTKYPSTPPSAIESVTMTAEPPATMPWTAISTTHMPCPTMRKSPMSFLIQRRRKTPIAPPMNASMPLTNAPSKTMGFLSE